MRENVRRLARFSPPINNFGSTYQSLSAFALLDCGPSYSCAEFRYSALKNTFSVPISSEIRAAPPSPYLCGVVNCSLVKGVFVRFVFLASVQYPQRGVLVRLAVAVLLTRQNRRPFCAVSDR